MAYTDIEASSEIQSVPGNKRRILKLIKGFLLSAIVVFTVTMFVMVPEAKEEWVNTVASRDSPAVIELLNPMMFQKPIWAVGARGHFIDPDFYNGSEADHTLVFSIMRVSEGREVDRMSEVWVVPIPILNNSGLNIITDHKTIELRKTFTSELDFYLRNGSKFVLEIRTDQMLPFPISLSLMTFSELSKQGIMMATGILILLYVLIIFEIIDRTLASMIGATAAIACLTLIGSRPTLAKVISWLDLETLCLLFGMMIMVGVLSETGFFDYVAVTAFRLARGQVWPMVLILCFFTAILSAFLDNVTTILLMTPVSIKLCEIKNVDPKHVLIAQVLFSNIGGAATPIGDPPNVIIINSVVAKTQGVDFANFTMHIMPGALLAAISALLVFWYFYRDVEKFNFVESPDVIVGRDMVMNFLKEQVEDMERESAEAAATGSVHNMECDTSSSSSSDENLKEEINHWKKTDESLGDTEEEQTVRKVLQTKVVALESQLRKKLKEKQPHNHEFRENLRKLEKKYRIKNKELLVKAGVVMGIVIVLFFMQSIPFMHLSLGWIAILGAICLLVMADIDDMESVFEKVEWPTLVFFACLFVVMEALKELRLLDLVGQLTQSAIGYFSPDWQLFMAINIILWVSAISSSFIDNIPFATVVVKVLENMAHSDALNIPMKPLVYSLAFGACLGGNGTLIGASANVVCAGVAERQGYKISFIDFFKLGFPIMLVTVATANVYLIVCHIAFNWT